MSVPAAEINAIAFSSGISLSIVDRLSVRVGRTLRQVGSHGSVFDFDSDLFEQSLEKFRWSFTIDGHRLIAFEHNLKIADCHPPQALSIHPSRRWRCRINNELSYDR